MTKIVRSHASRRLWSVTSLACVLAFVTEAAVGSTLAPCHPAVLTLDEAAELVRVDAAEIERLAARDEVPARRIGASWRFNCAALMAWLNGDWQLIAAAVAPPAAAPSVLVGPDAPRPLTARDMAEVTATGTAAVQVETTLPAGTSPSSDNQDEPIGEAPEERTAEDVFLRTQRVLLAPGDLTLDFGQFYSEGNSQPFASVDDAIVLATVEEEAFVTTFQGRIGIAEETELFAGTAYVSQDSDVFFGSQKLGSSSRSEFGAVRLGVRRTFMKEGPGRPNMIGTLTANIPTGDTSYAIGGGLAFVKSVDPAALFASVNYQHTFSEDFEDVTRLEPEDRLDVGFGIALALNDTLSLSTSVSGVFTSATQFSTVNLRQQDGYSLGFGLTAWLAHGVYVEPSVSFRLGGPDDSFAFGVNVFTFPR